MPHLSCALSSTGIDQYDRDSIINDFKSGVCKLLVATSVAARGLDVKHLMLVVNYSCPNHYEDYVHRAGRTGRAGNKVGRQFFLKKLTLVLLCFMFGDGNVYRLLSFPLKIWSSYIPIKTDGFQNNSAKLDRHPVLKYNWSL